jgi:hypothetical protein
VELMVARVQTSKRSTSPDAALFRGNNCLSCSTTVRGANREELNYREEGYYPSSPHPLAGHGNLPEMSNWHSSHTEPRNASRNARLHPPRSVSRTPTGPMGACLQPK